MLQIIIKCLLTYRIRVQNVVNSYILNIKYGAYYVTLVPANISTARTKCCA
jgi:hypothetical protein